jgi:uncharacterized repeat protein (TIGR03803 family)
MKRVESEVFSPKQFKLVVWMTIMALALTVTPRLGAQTFSNLHTFSGGNDGGSPESGVILSGTNLYGTAESGGLYGYGAVFALSTNGTSFTNLYSFTDGADGAYPAAGLVLSGTNLYGVTEAAGIDSAGTVFRINTNGSGFAVVYSFTGGNDGANPQAGLILSGTNLYGTTYDGGSFGMGTVFRAGTGGVDFTNLYTFTGGSDGGNPQATLVLSGTNLYGTTEFGGHPGVGYGTVFAVGMNGAGFATLHTFMGGEGANPVTGLTLSGTNLYGAAADGGVYSNGTLFVMSTVGTNFSVLHNFTATSASVYGGATTNYDGISPRGVSLSGTNLYGVAQFGGLYGEGTVFVAGTTGTNFTTVHAFTGGADGAEPADGLAVSNNVLYGTAEDGGGADAGTVFELTLLPPTPSLTGIHLSGPTLVISASGNGAGTYVLLTSTNLLQPFSQWTPITTNILTGGGSFFLTNNLDRTQPQRFFLLQGQ